ncbi:hypothetical protein [Nonomuraea glycinis]|uniref:hypothetical protein n=1 Tax=Nonomuraea glycinis TaxID=2047744 RepID=UPI0033AA8B7C
MKHSTAVSGPAAPKCEAWEIGYPAVCTYRARWKAEKHQAVSFMLCGRHLHRARRANYNVFEIDAEAKALADKTKLRGISVDGSRVTVDIVPPEEIAATWLHFARQTLGDAVNYAESSYEIPPSANTHPEVLRSITIPLHPAGKARERYTITVQRVGKLSPHEARILAEDRAQQADAKAERLNRKLAAAKKQRDAYSHAMHELGPAVAEALAAVRLLRAGNSIDPVNLERLEDVLTGRLQASVQAENVVSDLRRQIARLTRRAERAEARAEQPVDRLTDSTPERDTP